MILARPERSWVPVAVVLAAALGGTAAYLSPISAVVLAAIVGVIWVLIFPGIAIPLLIGISALNRVALSWGGAQVRVEILLTLLLTVVLVNRVVVRTLPWRRLSSPLLLPLLGYLGANIFSSLLFASEKSRALKLDAEILAATLTFLIVVVLIHRRVDLERAMRWMWITTVTEAAIGLAALAAFVSHVSTLGVQIGDFGLPMVYGTQWEANIFGSFLLGNFFLLLADYVGGRRSTTRAAGLAIVLLGILASMTRTVWLGLLLGLFVFAGASLRARSSRRGLFPMLIGLPVLALAGLIVGSATPFASRLLDVVNFHSSSAAGRLVIFDAALADWRHRPLFGTGTGSFNFGAVPGEPHPWLPNLFMLTLHDTGLVGIAMLGLVIVVCYRTFLAGIRPPADLSILLVGAVASFTALLVAFQSTTGFWFAYTWIVIGIGFSAARLNRPTA